MKTVFDKVTKDELIGRINALDAKNAAQWGKMTLSQMLRHCKLFEEMIVGKQQYKQAFLGVLFGKIALKGVLKDEQALRRNTPTQPDMVVKEDGDIISRKKEWIELIESYTHFSNHAFIHPFFGKMTTEQIGQLAYKHSDHHLRQFNG